MANNVRFLTSTQTKIEALKGTNTVSPGAFYLSNDSDRLYFGKSKNELALLNKAIVHVHSIESLNQLPSKHIGDFYYVDDPDVNVLCTWNGSKWVQINADTNTEEKISDWTSSVKTDVPGHPNEVEITQTLTIDKYSKGQKLPPISDSGNPNYPNPKIVTEVFYIKASDFANVITANLSTSAGSENNTAKINIGGTGLTGGTGAVLKGAGSISITGTGNDITISGVDNNTKYNLDTDSSASKVVLKADGGVDSGSVQFKAGSDLNVETTGTAQKSVVTYKHKAISTNHTENKKEGKQDKSKELVPAGTFTAINSATIENGHVTAYTTQEYKLPPDHDTHYKANAVSANNEGKITVKVSDKAGNDITAATSGQDLFYKVYTNKNKAVSGAVYNQGILPVYDSDYIDSALKEIDEKYVNYNAMVYKGPVGGSITLPTAGVKIGDTYKVNADTLETIPVENEEKAIVKTGIAHRGDLLIARGTESKEVITAESLFWDIIQAGDDVDSTYGLAANSNQIQLINTTSGKNTVEDFIKVTDDNTWIEATAQGDKLNIKHIGPSSKDVNKSVAVENPGDVKDITGRKVKYISGIDIDKNGHVVSKPSVAEIVVPDTTYTLPVTGTTNNATITLTPDGEGTNQPVSFTGDGKLTVDHSDTTITIHHAPVTTEEEKTTIEKGFGESFDVITGVALDKSGHTTKITTSTVSFPAAPIDKNATYVLSGITTSAITKGAKMQVDLTGAGEDSQSSSATMNFTSTNSNLIITPKTKAIEMSFVWEEF